MHYACCLPLPLCCLPLPLPPCCLGISEHAINHYTRVTQRHIVVKQRGRKRALAWAGCNEGGRELAAL